MLFEHIRPFLYRLQRFSDVPAVLELLKFRELRKAYYREFWRNAAASVGARYAPWDFGYARIERGGMTAVVNQYSVMLDSHLTLDIIGNKTLTYQLLQQKSCPLPEYRRFSMRNLAEAENFLKRIGKPVVVKPNSGTGGGNGVTTGISNIAALRRAARLASGFDTDLLIEEQVAGHSYRLLYLDGKLIDAVRRDPPILVGDGRSTVRQLIRSENDRRLSAAPVSALSPLRIDQDCRNRLASLGIGLRSVPASGTRLAIKQAANENAAGQNHIVTDDVHPRTISLGSRVVSDLGIRFAGVDIISPDISQPLSANGGRFGEINTTPGLHHHYLVAEERRGPGVAEILLEHFFANRTGVFILGDDPRRSAPVIEACDAA
jgi:D-alanine-D-alanine ligase-like ATP-grasp enzyme